MKIAAFLREIGVKRGDVVGLFAENCLEFPLVTYACFYLGVTLNACNPTYTAEELRHVLQLTKPRIVFTSSKALQTILKVSADAKCDFIQDIVSIDSPAKGKVWNFKDIMRNKAIKMEASFKPEAVNLSETIGLIQMSSGTTGLLKAVLISQENMFTSMAINV